MSKRKIQENVGIELKEKLMELADKSYIDLSVDDIFVLRRGDINKFIIKINELETWLDISDSVIIKELNSNINQELKEYNIEITKNSPPKDAKNLLEVIKEQRLAYKNNLLNSEKINLYTDKNVILKFEELSKKQKEEPHSAMLASKMILGGGVLSLHLENVGDLIYKMTEPKFLNEIHKTLDNIKPKIEKSIRDMSNGDFFKIEFEKNLKKNFDYNKKNNKFFVWDDFNEYEEEINGFLNDYSLAYSKLTTYNEMQYNAKYAAIYLGNREFNKSLNCLLNIEKSIIEGTYIEKVSEYTEAFEFKTLERLKEKIFSKNVKDLISLDLNEDEKTVKIFEFEMDKFSNKISEPEIVKDVLRYCSLKDKELLLSNTLNINKKAYLHGGFIETDKGLSFKPSKATEKRKQKRRP